MGSLNLNFVPTLQHMALAKVAIAIYSDREVQAFERSLNVSFCFMPDEMWMDFINKKVSSLVSVVVLQQRVSNLIRAISYEVYKWRHEHFKPKSNYLVFLRDICWTSLGTIDRLKTALRLLQSENIEVRNRFVLACLYCVEESIEFFWHQMNREQRRQFPKYNSSSLVRFYTAKLKKGTEIRWSKFISVPQPRIKREVAWSVQDISIGLRYFFTRLSSKEKQRCLAKAINQLVYPGDIRFYLCNVNWDELTRFFQVFYLELITYFLHWPLQSLFLDVLRRLWQFFTEESFANLVHCILQRILRNGWRDYDYVSLVQNIWSMCSDDEKERFMKHSLYKAFSVVNDYNPNPPKPFPLELLEECLVELSEHYSPKYLDDSGVIYDAPQLVFAAVLSIDKPL
ncbi:uncharacterized protein NPIL_697341 [Nephila pilipes]|uniref:Uncharacterized protein n=1 Tax=Nephila pilipes TaxID=299642 RepID=A0A8X6TR37_NEPPI|nr:uncharacterized protein NPIL_697341 [Nephila pilipes]